MRSLHSDDAAAPAPSLSGLTTTAKALYSVLLWQMTERPLLIVVDGNKQAEALYQALATFFNLLISASDRTGRFPCPRSTCCPCRTCRRTPRSASSAPSALAPGHAPRPHHRDAGGVRAAARRAARFLPAACPHAARGRRDSARRRGGAPGEHRLRAARAGGNGGRILGARRHPRRLLAGIAEAGAHRAVRRRGRIHPPLRGGVAAVRPQAGRCARCCR